MQSAKEILKSLEKEKGIFLTNLERQHFLREIKDMQKAGKEIDIQKAVHNARYLAEIDRRTEDIKAGKFIEFSAEDWEKLTNFTDAEWQIFKQEMDAMKKVGKKIDTAKAVNNALLFAKKE